MGSAKQALRATWEAASKASRLQDGYEASIVNDIFRHAMRKQTGVSLKYMLDFGQRPIEKQMILSAQFLRAELPIRLAHRVAELENLPFGLSSMRPILKVSAAERRLIAQCSISLPSCIPASHGCVPVPRNCILVLICYCRPGYNRDVCYPQIRGSCRSEIGMSSPSRTYGRFRPSKTQWMSTSLQTY